MAPPHSPNLKISANHEGLASGESAQSTVEETAQRPPLASIGAAPANKTTPTGHPQALSLDDSFIQLDTAAQSWLGTQCEMITGVSQAIVVKYPKGKHRNNRPLCIAQWPNENVTGPQALLTAALEATQINSVVIHSSETDDQSDPHTCIVASPLYSSEIEHEVVVFVLPGSIRRQHQALVQLLQWGATWYEIIRKEHHAQLPKDRLVNVVEMLASSLEHSSFDAAATTAVTELAARLSCTRVSLGMLEGQFVNVCAISNSARVDARSNMIGDIGSAMDEAVDQNATIAYPPLPDAPPHVAFAQEVLARRGNGCSVLSTPLYDGTRTIGALTLERDGDDGFDPSMTEVCEVFGALLGPVVELKHEKERWIGLKVMDAVRNFGTRLLGPKHATLKLYALLLTALVVFLSLATGDYRITAEATLEGSVRRVITAPRDGFVATAELRAGDFVDAGQLLATLDDRELRLERVKLTSLREQHNKEHRAAMTAHDRSTAAIVNAQKAQIEAQIALIDEQLTRSQLTAPLSGIVVSGDLSQGLGSPVKHGDVLFEVAPLDTYRVMLEIDERDIGEIATQQRGQLTLTGMPDTIIAFTVTKIVPISTARDGRNFFEVEATLDSSEVPIRPGMQGIGKIHVDERKLLWVWTHALVDWFRLSFWTWTS